jgi:hypothetical protein
MQRLAAVLRRALGIISAPPRYWLVVDSDVPQVHGFVVEGGRSCLLCSKRSLEQLSCMGIQTRGLTEILDDRIEQTFSSFIAHRKRRGTACQTN